MQMLELDTRCLLHVPRFPYRTDNCKVQRDNHSPADRTESGIQSCGLSSYMQVELDESDCG